jgi:hypothetical protein
MRVHTICALIFVLMSFVSQPSKGTVDEYDIALVLPASNELKDWNPIGQPQKFAGEDLFLYINGGAEIYYEYGFIQVMTQEYKNERGTIINLEVFEMVDPVSAYGIYTFKRGDTGQKLTIGNDGFLEAYYLNFWKANVLVTITGFDSDRETVDGLLAIARSIDDKIRSEGQRPILSDVLPKKNLRETSITYLKGNLGLYNHYEFDSENIFGLTEGVTGEYSGFQTFVFRYDTEKKCLQWYENARTHLENNPRFLHLKNTEDAFSMRDSEGRSITVELFQNYIIIIVAKERSDTETFLMEMKDRIEEYKKNDSWNN